jgi:hypothetical protein
MPWSIVVVALLVAAPALAAEPTASGSATAAAETPTSIRNVFRLMVFIMTS